MNRVELSGRFARDPDVRYTDSGSTVARFSIAVDRTVKKNDEWVHEADFISCVAFGRTAEFIEKYFNKGSFIIVLGNIKTGSYTNKDNVKVYTTDVLVEKAEFGGGKAENSSGTDNNDRSQQPTSDDGFMNIPDGIDEELPFN